jgi:LAS superfamily LD-carboxypeptidase LdcB
VFRWWGIAVLVVVAGCAGPAEPLAEDGYIPDGEQVSPFDDESAAVNRLDPDLLAAVRAASRDAADDGVTIGLTSGWRSADLQQRLLTDAADRYGSLDEARRYVSTPDTSAHVVGKAVDIGPTAAADWMGWHGADHGLCQTYANEMWHFELAVAPGADCPPAKPDSSG